jgi:hypothetical protein
MRRFLILALMVAVLAGSVSAYANPTYSSLSTKDARSMGSGGTSLLFSTGYDCFFGNPAGLAGPGSLTLGDASLWGYLPVTPGNLNELQALLEGTPNSVPQADVETAFDNFLADNSELGFGGSVGLGWAGKGFGVGATVVSEARLAGYDFANSRIVVQNQFNAILGFGVPVNLGPLHLSVGADARAFYRLDTRGYGWGNAHDIVLGALGYDGYDFDSLVNPKYMTGGFGYAIDAGATLKLGPFMAGFMARDLFGKLQLGDATVQDIMENANYPMDGTNEVSLEATYTGGVGLSFNENGLFAPSLYAETDDIPGLVEAIKSGLTDTESVLASIRVGGQLRLLKIFLLRGGLNKNCLSVGAGIDLHLIRVDVAMFGEDIGDLQPRTGLSVRAAVKF